MPRSLVFGNGCFYLAFDSRGRLRELCWPRVGQPNHLLGRTSKWAMFVDDQLSWLDSDEWEIEQHLDSAGVMKTELKHNRFGVQVVFEDFMHPVNPVFVRRVTVTSSFDQPRRIKLFSWQDLDVNESTVSNGGQFHPRLKGIVHSKGSTSILFCVKEPVSGWTVSVKPPYGPGSMGDLADGVLNMKGAEVGAIDSALCWESDVSAKAPWHSEYRICAASIPDALIELAELEIPTPEGEPSPDWFSEFDDRIQQVLRASKRVVSANTDRGGGMLAAIDSDIMIGNTVNYSNCWPRDAALTALTLIKIGQPGRAKPIIEFFKRLLPTTGLYRQKYWPDGSIGPTWHPMIQDGYEVEPVQVDETALLALATAKYIQATGDSDRLTQYCLELLERLTEFLGPDSLPMPSWDLWEERRGISFFGFASVLAAFRNAPPGAAYTRATLAKLEAAMTKFEIEGRYARQINVDGQLDLTPDSALVAGLLLLESSFENSTDEETFQFVRERLNFRSPVGGCARYEGDYYWRKSELSPGNPWIICTLWIAQAELARGNKETAKSLLGWAADRASKTGMLPEQCHPDSGEPLSVSPLTWSHAEFLLTAYLISQT